jgi:hypothetical protein
VSEWLVTFRSSKRVLIDTLLKTGSLLIRPRFIDHLKNTAQHQRVKFSVQNPEGAAKLSSSFVLVEVMQMGKNGSPVMGLFEYAYGAMRIVAIDNEELASKDGDAIIAFFESAAKSESSTVSIKIIEPIPIKKL